MLGGIAGHRRSPAAAKTAGFATGGATLLPNQWSLRPTGKQVELANFPVNVALHPQGEWAVVLHSGYGPHVIAVVNVPHSHVEGHRVVSSVTVPKSFYGLCFSPNGKRLFVSGGEDDVVHEFHFADGYLYDHKAIKLPKDETALVATGLSCSPDGKRLYAACCLGDRLLPTGAGRANLRKMGFNGSICRPKAILISRCRHGRPIACT